jgi:hypothetical protein
VPVSSKLVPGEVLVKFYTAALNRVYVLFVMFLAGYLDQCRQGLRAHVMIS